MTIQDNTFPLQNSSFHYLTKPKLHNTSLHFSITVLIQLITFLNQHLTPLPTTFTLPKLHSSNQNFTFISLNNSSQNKTLPLLLISLFHLYLLFLYFIIIFFIFTFIFSFFLFFFYFFSLRN